MTEQFLKVIQRTIEYVDHENLELAHACIDLAELIAIYSWLEDGDDVPAELSRLIDKHFEELI